VGFSFVTEARQTPAEMAAAGRDSTIDPDLVEFFSAIDPIIEKGMSYGVTLTLADMLAYADKEDRSEQDWRKLAQKNLLTTVSKAAKISGVRLAARPAIKVDGDTVKMEVFPSGKLAEGEPHLYDPRHSKWDKERKANAEKANGKT